MDRNTASTGRRRWVRLAAVTVLLVFAAGAATASSAAGPALPADIEAIMNKPQYAHASWGLLDEDAATGAAGYALRPGEEFIPGSNAKLFSVSAVWNILGPDHRFTTPVYALGRRAGATLDGRLVLFGVGDLSLGGRTTRRGTIAWTNFDHGDANAIPGATLTPENPLAGIKALARQVRRSGIRRVRGDVLIDDRLFTATFDPQPTPVMINDNLIDLVVKPGRVGGKAHVTFRPSAPTYTVRAHVRTVGADQPTNLSVSGQAPGKITVSGQIAAGSQPQVRVAPIADPASFARTVFIEALRHAGVRIDASARGPNPADELPRSISYPRRARVAAYTSPPYADYAKLILKVSHNLGANLGICLLAVHAGSRDCDAGFGPLRSFLKRAGVPIDQVALGDGRGGDPVDRASPVAVIQLLRYWVDKPDFAAFRDTLPILGRDGSLVDVATHTPARGRVFAKTGTLIAGDPLSDRLLVQTKALAGYYQAANGAWRMFDLVVNNAGSGQNVQPVLDANEDLGQIAAALWRHAN